MGGRLPLEVIFIANNFKDWFCPLHLSLKLKKDPSAGYKDIPNSKHPQWVGGCGVKADNNATQQAETCQIFS
jgi:hypothetical protein